jgi:hypothetical protein
MRRLVSALVAAALTAVCLWVLLTPEVLTAMRRLGTQARPLPILAAFALGALVQWLRAWRFAVMTTGRLALPGAALVRIAFQLNALNFLLHSAWASSDASAVRRRFGHDLLHSAGVLLLPRLFDLAAVGAILLVRRPRCILWRILTKVASLRAWAWVAPLEAALAGQAAPSIVRLSRVGGTPHGSGGPRCHRRPPSAGGRGARLYLAWCSDWPRSS